MSSRGPGSWKTIRSTRSARSSMVAWSASLTSSRTPTPTQQTSVTCRTCSPSPRYVVQGVGRALIESVVEWARERGCSRVYWQTKNSNTTARRLYDQVATHKGFIVYQIDP